MWQKVLGNLSDIVVFSSSPNGDGGDGGVDGGGDGVQPGKGRISGQGESLPLNLRGWCEIWK